MSTPTPNHYQAPIPLLPLRGAVLLPGSRLSVPVGRRKSLALLRDVGVGGLVVVGVQRDPAVREPTLSDLYEVGTLARIVAIEPLAGSKTRPRTPGPERLRVALEGVERCTVGRMAEDAAYWSIEAGPVDEVFDAEAAPLARALVKGLSERLTEDRVRAVLPERDDPPSLVADRVGAILRLSADDAATVLTTLDVAERLRLVTHLAGELIESSDIEARLDAEVREALTRQQREALLRQRLRAIRKELGEDPTDDSGDELSELRQTLEGLDLPESVRKQVQRELRRLDNAQGIAGADAHVTRTWLEWVAALPWGQSVDSETDLDVVKKQLDADHHGLEDVKKRILEHIAVLKLTGGDSGTLLCLAGPPGVGKTSLGRSIAEAMGRPFVRVALGGVRDEAEIRGHRRTYVGAVPGRILHALRTAGADNPVFLLDEIDKLATAGWGGSPEAALLEVLDPEQNSTFTDHYLEVPYDLSKVLFICTANDLSRLSPPLRDRLEVVEISGYTPVEKATIARDHLIPEALQKHGVADGALSIDDAALDDLISRYTREAGVRQLKRELARLCRSLALEVARDDVGDGTLQVDTDNLPDYLGRPRFTEEVAERLTQPGVATGLAWTPSGGDILFIETSRMPGKGSLEVTGQLGDVMKESARAAMTYVRSNAEALGISPDFLAAQDVHIHVPAGGIPKDGPSAGVTIFTALTSLLTGKKVRSDTAMTGECTLRGRVLPVGGIKSKVMAAHRAGLTRVILPRACERDLDDVPQSVRDGLEVLLVDDMSEVLQAALAA